jgi:hypothetical protein
VPNLRELKNVHGSKDAGEKLNINNNVEALVRELTTPTEQSPFVGEDNVCEKLTNVQSSKDAGEKLTINTRNN